MYVPGNKQIRTIRRADFKPLRNEKLPSVAALLDGLSRQHSIEAEENSSDGQAEAHIVRCLISVYKESPIITWDRKQRVMVHDVPSSYEEACQIPKWAAAIDREFDALERRKTWEYVLPKPNMNIIKHKWIFRKIPLDAQGKTFLPKARCVARGDLQEAYVDFDPDTLYAPVAAHASIRLILAYAASKNLIIEGGDISNAYLYGEIDKTIYMDQPTTSSGKTRKPGYVCKLLKSIYGVKQAGNIWGSVVHGDIVQWRFKVSKFDSRLYFLRIGEDFIIIALVVDDMCFATNNRELLDQLKFKLSAKFDVKFYGSLTYFIGWNITHAPQGLKLDQTEYARSLLKTCGMEHCKAVSSTLPIGADLLPASPHEQLQKLLVWQNLSKRDHQAYRAIVGGLLYLSVCTRPHLSFPTSALARQMHAPCDRHFKYLKRILRYVAGTLEYGLFYPRLPCTPSSIGAAVDAD